MILLTFFAYLWVDDIACRFDYRALLKNTHVVPIGSLMGEEADLRDDQIVSVAGIVQTVKMKTTRNNSMMAYITLEDDTAAMEMLAFSNVLSQFGGYLKENSPVVITGRLSLRDDKEPQIVINRARPMTDKRTPFTNHITRPPCIKYWSKIYLSFSLNATCGSAIITAL